MSHLILSAGFELHPRLMFSQINNWAIIIANGIHIFFMSYQLDGQIIVLNYNTDVIIALLCSRGMCRNEETHIESSVFRPDITHNSRRKS
jgi:hypothetical protein